MNIKTSIAVCVAFVAVVSSSALGFSQRDNSTARHSHGIKPLIVGGNEVPIGDKTYVTGLRRSAGEATFCGGALITPTHVLSAGHCAGAKYVTVGSHFRVGPSDGQEVRVKREVRHPNYSEPTDNTASYDFLILELVSPVVGIEPVSILRADPSAVVGSRATTIGWGATGFPNGFPFSNVLLRSDGPVVSDVACAKAGLSPLDKSMMCAGGAAKSGGCFGDSGGPLVLEQPRGDVLIGVVSWGYPHSCGLEGKPVVFGRVALVIDWIKSIAPGVAPQCGA